MKFIVAVTLALAAFAYAEEDKKYITLPYGATPYAAAYPYALPYAPYPYGFAAYKYTVPTYTFKSSFPYPALHLDITKEPAAYAAYPYAAFPTASGYGVLKKAE